MFCKIYFSRYFIIFANNNIVAMIFNMYWHQPNYCVRCYFLKD